jgi:hypothetical protein
MTKEQKAINIQATGSIVDVKQDIPITAERFCIERLHQTDPAKITQGQFNAVLLNIQDNIIIPNMDLWCKHNKGMLDDDILLELYDIYTRLCMEYDKHSCVWGFSCLTGIDENTIYAWSDGKVTPTRMEICKRLKAQDEHSLQDLLITGKRNPVGIVAVLNNKHGWSSQNIRHETTVKTSDNLQIASSLGLAIEQKS